MRCKGGTSARGVRAAGAPLLVPLNPRASPHAALPATDPNSPVTFFSDIDFQGTKATPPAGSGQYVGACQSLASCGIYLDIKSVLIAPGYTVIFYDDVNLGGSSIVLTANAGLLQGYSTQASGGRKRSLAVFQAPSFLVKSFTIETNGWVVANLYADCGPPSGAYGSMVVSLYPGDYPYMEWTKGMSDNMLSAVDLAPGYRATLYSQYMFTGDNVTLTARSTVCLTTNKFNDRTMSLKIDAASGTPAYL